MLYNRNLTYNLIESSEDTPVILLNAARQSGKSTLLNTLLKKRIPSIHTINLDDITTLAALKNSPQAYLRNIQAPILIDEVQRAPEIFVELRGPQLLALRRKPLSYARTVFPLCHPVLLPG